MKWFFDGLGWHLLARPEGIAVCGAMDPMKWQRLPEPPSNGVVCAECE